MTDERLAALERLVQAATAGPWEVHPVNNNYIYGPRQVVARTYWNENREFIAESRTALPELIAEVRRLKAEQFFVRTRLLECEEGTITPEEFYYRIAGATSEEIAGLYDALRHTIAESERLESRGTK